MKHGGGADFRLIQETELYIRVNGKPGRAIGMAMWDTLQQDCKTALQLSLWRHAVVKTLYVGPEKLISPADVKRSLGPQLFSEVCKFELMLKELKSQGRSMPAKDLASILVKFELEACLIILGKKPKEPCGISIYAALEEAAHFKCTEDMKLPSSPWAGKVNPASAVASSSSKKADAATMDARSGAFVLLGRGVKLAMVHHHSFDFGLMPQEHLIVKLEYTSFVPFAGFGHSTMMVACRAASSCRTWALQMGNGSSERLMA